jgi:flagellar hook-basal body complex protein FliE
MDINYGSAISKVVPGTFVPDIGSSAPKSQPLPDDAAGVAGSSTTSFKDAVKGFLSDVNDKMLTADQKSQDLALGKSNDLEGTVKSLEEATLAMQFTLSVRNKLLEAYQEIQRMPV